MDIFNVIRMVLDLLGFDLFHLPIWDVDHTNIRHRSVVRRIASKLPLKPAKRATFQKHLLSLALETESDTNLLQNLDCANLADIGWLNEQSFCSGIQTRSDSLRRKSLVPKFFVTSSFHDESISSISQASPQINVSEQSNVGPTFSTPDPFALQKINQLEDQLALLREQIASIVLSQEVSANGPINNVAPPPRPPPPPPCGVPPPPPPPPIAIMTPKKSLTEIIKENKAKLGKFDDPTSTPTINTSKRLDMAEVLKGIGSVKLKSVERSPGGTPMRRPPLAADPSDAATMIALALKKKFEKTRQFYSPNKENNLSYESSPDNSPTVTAPTLLKPSQLRRKSGLFQDRKLAPSPLTEKN